MGVDLHRFGHELRGERILVVVLDLRHVRRSQLPPLGDGVLDALRNASGTISVVEVLTQIHGLTGGGDGIVRGDDPPALGVVQVRQILEVDPALPILLGLPSSAGHAAVGLSAAWDHPGGLVADIAGDIGVDEVL